MCGGVEGGREVVVVVMGKEIYGDLFFSRSMGV